MLARYVHARLWWRVTGQRYTFILDHGALYNTE